MNNGVDLEAELDAVKKDVKTDSYPMSLGEVSGMYERDEIVLRPEYQRYMRWNEEQKSKLIESVLIGLPLPSFFVSQDDQGRWEVVDGMQRLSTLFDFMGILKEDITTQEYYKKFTHLSPELFYLKAYEGKSWGELPKRIQLDFRRTKVQLVILLRETSPDAKFELFQRLNSGGTKISGQELRNAILASENPEFLKWLESLAEDENFVSVCGLAESDLSTRYDVELVLRFVAFLSDNIDNLRTSRSIDTYLTSFLRRLISGEVAVPDDAEIKFRRTFEAIHAAWGEGALKFRNAPGEGRFSISFFELVALGLAQGDAAPEIEELKQRMGRIGDNAEYRRHSGSGKNARDRMPRMAELGANVFLT